MMLWDKKKAMTAIMSKRSKDGSVESAPMQPSSAKEEDGAMDGRHAAAQDIMMALNEKHPGKLMEAMSNFMDMHAARNKSEKAEDSTPVVPAQPKSES